MLDVIFDVARKHTGKVRRTICSPAPVAATSSTAEVATPPPKKAKLCEDKDDDVKVGVSEGVVETAEKQDEEECVEEAKGKDGEQKMEIELASPSEQKAEKKTTDKGKRKSTKGKSAKEKSTKGKSAKGKSKAEPERRGFFGKHPLYLSTPSLSLLSLFPYSHLPLNLHD